MPVPQVVFPDVALKASKVQREGIRGRGLEPGTERGPGPEESLYVSLILGCFAIINQDKILSEFGFGLESLSPCDEKLAGTWRLNCCSADTFLTSKGMHI